MTPVEKACSEILAVLEAQTPDVKQAVLLGVFGGGMRDLMRTHSLAPAIEALLGADGLAIAAVLPLGIHCESTCRDDADEKTRRLVGLCYDAMNDAIETSGVGFLCALVADADRRTEPAATAADLAEDQRRIATHLARHELALCASYLRSVLGPRRLDPGALVAELLEQAKAEMPSIDPRAPRMWATLTSAVADKDGRAVQPGDLVQVQVPPNCSIHDADAQRLARIRAIAAELGMVYRTAAERLRERMAATLPPEKVGWVGAPYPAIDNHHLNVALAELAELTANEPVWHVAESPTA